MSRPPEDLHDVLQIPPDIRAQCYGKPAYVSQAQAHKVLAYKRRRMKATSCGRMRPYKCPNCGLWHNGGSG